MTKTDEILSAIRYAPGPIGVAGIYEKVRSVEDIKDLSATLSYLHKGGRVERSEVTTPAGRKSFAYSIPGPVAADSQADSAPAAASAGDPSAGLPNIDIPAPADAVLPRSKPGPKPKAAQAPASKSGLADTDPEILRAGAAAAADRVLASPDKHKASRGDESLADAIIARLKQSFAPLQAKLGASAGHSVSIHIERLEIRVGRL